MCAGWKKTDLVGDKYKEKNLCIALVIYQESLYDVSPDDEHCVLETRREL